MYIDNNIEITDETLKILEKVYLQENPKCNFWIWFYNLYFQYDDDYIYWYNNEKLIAITL